VFLILTIKPQNGEPGKADHVLLTPELVKSELAKYGEYANQFNNDPIYSGPPARKLGESLFTNNHASSLDESSFDKSLQMINNYYKIEQKIPAKSQIPRNDPPQYKPTNLHIIASKITNSNVNYDQEKLLSRVHKIKVGGKEYLAYLPEGANQVYEYITDEWIEKNFKDKSSSRHSSSSQFSS
jgi:hypothetical protein